MPLRVAAITALMLSSCQLVTQAPNRPGYNEYGITKLSGELEFSVESRDETRSSTSGDRSIKELRFREQISLGLAGFYYHPKLIEFDLKGLLGLEQRDVKTNGDVGDRAIDGQNLGYDFAMRFFKDLAYTSEVYASRTETLTRQSFFATNESVAEQFGLRLGATDWWIPSLLDINHFTFEGRGFNTYAEQRDSVRLEGRREQEEDASYQYFAEINKVDLQSLSESLTDLNMHAGTKHMFGATNMNRWSNSVTIREQTGALESGNFLFNSDYVHELTENLRSQSGLLYSTTSRGESETDILSLNTNLNHQLFSSLTSSGGARWASTSFGDGSLDTYGVNAALTYNKETPLGKLALSQSLDTTMRDRGSLQGDAIVLGESFVYTPGQPMFLSNIAVDAFSVIVRDGSGLIVYTRNVDYFVVQVGSRTRVDIPVTSLISSGDTILVDYDFQPSPEQETQTVTTTSSATLSVPAKASFTIGRSVTTQTLESGFDDGTLEESTRTFANANYFPWTITTLSADFEDFQSNLSPFKRVSASVSQEIPLFETLDWQSSARTYHVTFGDDPRAETGSSASTSLTAYLSNTMYASFNAEYHTAKYRTDEGAGYMAEFEFKKSLGKTIFTLSTRYVEEEFEFADDQSLMYLQFYMTREF